MYSLCLNKYFPVQLNVDRWMYLWEKSSDCYELLKAVVFISALYLYSDKKLLDPEAYPCGEFV